MAKTKDITGMKFGMLTAIRFNHKNKNGYYWLFRCDCGNEKVILKNHVVRGKIKSCGCKISKYYNKDIIGMKFGKLTVIKSHHKINNGSEYMECKCDCGNTKIISKNHLLSGKIKSCGCYAKEVNTNRVRTHNLSNTRIYKCWRSMKERCSLPSCERYKNYGGRGIKVCDEWLDKENGFINFYNWAINNGYSDNLTIDRIDVNGNYKPSNCRWTTKKEQANNTTRNHYLTYNNETLTVSEWSSKLNYSYKKLLYKAVKYNDDMNIIMENLKNELS